MNDTKIEEEKENVKAMLLKVKLKENGKWRNPEVGELVGTTLIRFIAESFCPCVAGMYSTYEGKGKPFLIISNTEEVFKFYDDLTVKLLAGDVLNLLELPVGIKLAMMLDVKSELFEIRRIEPEKDPSSS